jgi:hypothetical protein
MVADKLKTLNLASYKTEGWYFFVRMEGLEPPCLAALDPKSSASTNFATSAEKDDVFKSCFQTCIPCLGRIEPIFTIFLCKNWSANLDKKFFFDQNIPKICFKIKNNNLLCWQ